MSKRGREGRHQAASSGIVDILNKQREQAQISLAAAISSPARTPETIPTRPSDDDDDDVEQGIRTPAAVAAASAAVIGEVNTSDSSSVVSTGSASGKKRIAKTSSFIKNIVPKGVRKQGRRLFNVVKHATADRHYHSSDDDHDDAAIAIDTIITTADNNNETTPLLGGTQGAARSSSLPEIGSTWSPEKKKRIIAAWKQLADKVKSGEFLLETTMGRGYSSFHDSDSGSDNNTADQVDIKSKRLKAQEAIQSSLEFSLWHSLLAIILYMVIAILAFKFFLEPSWTIIDCMYFAMVTFTTIGYGDLSPHNHVGRVFTVIYALSGVACLGIALGVLGNSVIEAQNQAAEKTKELAEKRVISLFSSDDDDNDDSENGSGNGDNVTAQKEDNTVKEQKEAEKVQQQPILQVAKELSCVSIILIVFACLMADDPGMGDTDHWDIVNSMYYAIITASTVGYGDFAPQSQRGRLIALIFIPLAVGAMGHFLGTLASIIMNAKQESFRRDMQSKELTYHDLEIMDADGSGHVTQSEFIEFMLVAMNKVDKDFIEELRAHFNRLDTDGTGYLCKGDLIHNARKKIKTAEKKMELKAYKEKLLAQSAAVKRQVDLRSHNQKKRSSFFNIV